MSILVATPCYGGMCTVHYAKSCINLSAALDGAGIGHDYHLGWNESLVQRARNSMGALFLQTEWKKLLFIDADIEFRPEDVAALWNLDALVCAGVYAMKLPDKPLSAWKDGKLVDLKECPTEPFEVDYAGTGFMMIDRDVLTKMQAAWPERKHQEGCGESFLWFDPRKHPKDNFYMSEDYAFCHDARSLGFAIWVDPSIKLIHHGSYGYAGAETNKGTP